MANLDMSGVATWKKSGLVSIFLHIHEKSQWGIVTIVYHRQQTVDFLPYSNLRESADFSHLKMPATKHALQKR